MNANPVDGRSVWGRRWFASPPLVLAAFSALADTSDLMDIYRRAQARDPAYRGAIYVLQAARERLPQARAGLLPVLNLVGSNGQQSGQASFSEAPYVDRNVRSHSWNLQLTQPLWRAVSWAALGQAERQEQLAKEQFRQAEQELILRSAQVYLDVLVAQEAERVARLQVAAVEQQLEGRQGFM